MTGILFTAGGIVGEMTSTTRPAFLLSKMILGFGLSFYLTVGPLYCSEVCVWYFRGVPKFETDFLNSFHL